ncbi:MAG: hypothetical protein IKL52_07650 [Candidatus Gastranaerophilales bacterium]|nr:hypothetical protein [Candidatus Gastranaerophilales bacterium]
MRKNVAVARSDEQNEIMEYLFQGLTISQIARKMHCASSTVSYQLSLLYAKYGVNTRSEFLVKIYSDIIDNYKNLINLKDTRILSLEHKLSLIKNVLSSLLNNQTNPGIFDYWASEAKRHL